MRAVRMTLALAGAVALALPAAAQGAGIEVVGAALRVSIGVSTGTGSTGAQVNLLPDGSGAIVSLHGQANSTDRTVGPGCQEVGTANANPMPSGFPGSGAASFAATCSLAGVRVIEGRLYNSLQNANQGWFSTINLPTTVTTAGASTTNPAFNKIFTGNGGDRITGSADTDEIDAGGAPYKGQEASPDDPNQNIVNGAGGNDTFLMTRGLGRDMVTGGVGIDHVTYADRFGVGAPGSTGVNITVDGQPNDGDPAIDQLDSTAPGEGDNIGTDVENLTGTKRNDMLIGNGLVNTLFGDEGVDVLTGNAGEDTIIAREPAVATSGTPDTISCGSPSPGKTGSSTIGIFSTTGSDRLEKDLADVKPADCELLVDMAVDEPAPVNIARTAKRAGRGKQLHVQLTCPRKAQRTCRGKLRLAGKRSGSKAAKFSIRGGAKRTVKLRLSRAAARALARRRVVVQLVSNETGLKGEVNRISLARVRR